MKNTILTMLLLILFSCQKKTIHHSFLQDLVVVDKIYHIDDTDESFEYIIRDSFGRQFSYNSTDHFSVGDKVQLTLKY